MFGKIRLTSGTEILFYFIKCEVIVATSREHGHTEYRPVRRAGSAVWGFGWTLIEANLGKICSLTAPGKASMLKNLWVSVKWEEQAVDADNSRRDWLNVEETFTQRCHKRRTSRSTEFHALPLLWFLKPRGCKVFINLKKCLCVFIRLRTLITPGRPVSLNKLRMVNRCQM